MPLYFDNNATTPLDPQVKEAMIQEMELTPANPSSVHQLGRQAKARLISARDSIAAFFKVKPNEIYFNSGGTEGLNTLIKGLNLYGKHVITSNCEHAAVDKTLNILTKQGVEVTKIEVGLFGSATKEQVLASIKNNTALILLIGANNETGVKTDLQSIATVAKEHQIPFIVDGVSLLGKEPFEMHEGISAITFSAHKFHGPLGIGFSIIRKGLKISPLISGGLQEYELRGGTENLIGIQGLAKAISLLQNQDQYLTHMRDLRDHFENQLLQTFPFIRINGTGPRIANTSNLLFDGLDGEMLLMQLDLKGVCTSHGSACSSGALEPSRILLNMGLKREEARASLRFSFSRFNTMNEINIGIDLIKSLINS